MPRRAGPLWLGVFILASVFLALPLPGLTRLTLADGSSGRVLYSGVLDDGQQAVLTWRNSLFGLDVTEVFVARAGVLVETDVTFADPAGATPPRVPAAAVDDLFQTGGTFAASGLERPFRRIVYRISEIGHPKMQIGRRVVAFKDEVGFGGSVMLSANRATPWQALQAAIKGDRP